MASRLIPQELLPWGLSVLGNSHNGGLPALSVVAGDASARRYFRFVVANCSYVLVEAPPATEKNEAFTQIAELLRDAGVTVPRVLGVDFSRGFLLLEDLGDQLLLPALHRDSVDARYRQAFEVLAKMASTETVEAELGGYDRSLLGEELGRFQAWFVQHLLGCAMTTDEQALWSRMQSRLIDSALEQPRVLVHRDFHSRNLMLTGDNELAVIDFQDAVVGPITYDLASLLRDCYIRWPAAQVSEWALSYRDLLHERGLLTDIAPAQFLRWFDWMGLQRHLKVLGTFSRLYLRDDKPGYLADLPLVIDYVLEITHKYAAEDAVFAEFGRWFSQRLSPLIAQQDWSKAL